ncbi:unnamed protein product, partial [Effrenium voratum]
HALEHYDRMASACPQPQSAITGPLCVHPLSATMAFVMPANKAAASGTRGRKPHVLGEKLWPQAIMHKSSGFLKAYPGKATLKANGETSTMVEALGTPQLLLSPEAWAGALSPQNTELLNRPAIGISECAGCLENFKAVVDEGLAKELLHPKLAEKVNTWWATHRLDEALPLLNTQGYPDLDRSGQNLTRAVANYLKAVQEVRGEWATWARILGAGSCLVVDSVWLLSAAALTGPGALATGVAEVPVKVDGKKAALVADPTNGLAVRDFLTAEVQALHGIRVAARQAAPLVVDTFQPLQFESEDEAPAAAAPVRPRKVPKAKREALEHAVEGILTMRVKKTDPTAKQQLKDAMQDYNAAFAAVAAISEDKAAELGHPDSVRDKFQKLKQKLRG